MKELRAMSDIKTGRSLNSNRSGNDSYRSITPDK